MLRTSIFAVAALALIVVGSASAATVNYGEINFHHGFIVVRNDIVATVDGRPTKERGMIYLGDSVGVNVQDQAVTGTGGTTLYFNNCCVVAGSLHKVRFTFLGSIFDFKIQPRLCNVRGIPFGFGAITLTGTAERGPNEKWVVHATPHVTTPACPPS